MWGRRSCCSTSQSARRQRHRVQQLRRPRLAAARVHRRAAASFTGGTQPWRQPKPPPPFFSRARPAAARDHTPAWACARWPLTRRLAGLWPGADGVAEHREAQVAQALTNGVRQLHVWFAWSLTHRLGCGRSDALRLPWQPACARRWGAGRELAPGQPGRCPSFPRLLPLASTAEATGPAAERGLVVLQVAELLVLRLSLSVLEES